MSFELLFEGPIGRMRPEDVLQFVAQAGGAVYNYGTLDGPLRDQAAAFGTPPQTLSTDIILNAGLINGLIDIVGAKKSMSLSTRSASKNEDARVGPLSSSSDCTSSAASCSSSSSSGPESSSSTEPSGRGPCPKASRRG